MGQGPLAEIISSNAERVKLRAPDVEAVAGKQGETADERQQNEPNAAFQMVRGLKS